MELILKKHHGWLIGSLTIIVSGVTLIKIVEAWRNRSRTVEERRASQLEAINLQDLQVLLGSNNYLLRRSVQSVVIDIASQRQYLSYFIDQTSCDDIKEALHAVMALNLISKSAVHKKYLYDLNGLQAICCCLMKWQGYQVRNDDVELIIQKERILRILCSTLVELICDPECNKFSINRDIICTLLALISSPCTKEVGRLSLFVLHQLSITENAEVVKLDSVGLGAISVISKVIMNNRERPVTVKICLHMLALLSHVKSKDNISALTEIGQHKVYYTAIMYFTADDEEARYWAATLIHEFVCNDIYRKEISCIPTLMKSCRHALSKSDSGIQKIILRICSFLVMKDDQFYKKILECKGFLNRLPICLASSDYEVAHWTLALVHDLAMIDKEVSAYILNAMDGFITCFTESLMNREDRTIIHLIAETLGFFCSCENFHTKILKENGIVPILRLLNNSDSGVRLWAVTMLLNLSMSNDQCRLGIVKEGGVKCLVNLALSDSEQSQTSSLAAKTLVMLSLLDIQITIHVSARQEMAYIRIGQADYHIREDGFHFIELDPFMMSVISRHTFEPSLLKLSQEIKEYVDAIDHDSIVVLCARGVSVNDITAKCWSSLSKLGLLQGSLSNHDSMVAYVGAKETCEGYEFASQESDQLQVDLDASFSIGLLVNRIIQREILTPLISLLLCHPARDSVSKVTELELLHILARQKDNRQLMILYDGFLDYLSELIWHFCHIQAESLHLYPMVIYHCDGAIKILATLSAHNECCHQMCYCGIVDALASLILRINKHRIQLLDKQLDKGDDNYWGNDSSTSRVAFFSQAEDILSNSKPTRGSPRKSKATLQLASPLKRFCSTSSDLDTSFNNSFSLQASQISNSLDAYIAQSNVDNPPTPRVGEYLSYEDTYATLTNLTTYCFARLIAYPLPELYKNYQAAGILYSLWTAILSCHDSIKESVGLYVEYTISNMVIESTSKGKRVRLCNYPALSASSRTPSLIISPDHLEACNESWTFESVLADVYVCKGIYDHSKQIPDGWYYEVILKTPGIIQIGWARKECCMLPEKGYGVGDDEYSYAFDGSRCKKWHNMKNVPLQDHMRYGREWKEGDIISCLLSSSGDISYWHNGNNLGIAFSNIDLSHNWYPGASLSTEQQCIFNFTGNEMHPFRYKMPSQYVAIGSTPSFNKKSSKRKKKISISNSDSFNALEGRTIYVPDFMIYYEVSLQSISIDVEKYGFWWTNNINKFYCKLSSDRKLTMPDGEEFDITEKQLIIGCGLCLPDLFGFFTVNGQQYGQYYKLEIDDSIEGLPIPYFTNFNHRINYGESEFLYQAADKSKARLKQCKKLQELAILQSAANGRGNPLDFLDDYLN
ncbi:RING finger and SPRY domain-containing protein 1 [Trichoplax sp. H2]|nr:RING finger and SPRY domain-containing protein 1 [Trichoplax sp. H2]|eukprot:RDD40548.1 RING finger and SPRY domain-containing protein 1 [Trichoplax sp. H2]